VRPARANRHGAAWQLLLARRQDIVKWAGDDVMMVKIRDLPTVRDQ
jgi:hypothetical protein